MVTDLRAATALLPGMLGADQPRRYLLVVQNDGESRATGGIIGGYGFLRATQGRLSLDVSTARLPSFGTTPVLALDKEMQTRYARFGIAQYWANPNLTPDYPTAARIFAAMWTKGTGQHVDGVVTVDPTLLGYLLAPVGTARMPDGQLVNGQQLAPLLESQIYARIPTNEQRDIYFSAAGAAIYRALLASGTSPVRLLPALGRGAGEGRLLVWSRRPAEQHTMQTTPLAGQIPSTPGPFLGVVTQNAAGSKLDYWLRRATDYRLRRLADGSAEATLTVRVTNTAPPRGLPAYVRLRIEDGAPRHPPPAQNKIYLSVYTGVGAGFTGATLDGRPTTLESETETGHGVFSTFLTINAGQTRTLRLVIAEPLWAPRVSIRPQPLVQPERLGTDAHPGRPERFGDDEAQRPRLPSVDGEERGEDAVPLLGLAFQRGGSTIEGCAGEPGSDAGVDGEVDLVLRGRWMARCAVLDPQPHVGRQAAWRRSVGHPDSERGLRRAIRQPAQPVVRGAAEATLTV